MKDVQINDYNTLAERVNVEKSKLSISLLEIGKICLEAKETLGMDNWKEWLIDSRVSIQISQAKKFIAVYKCYKDKSQSTGFLDNNGVEHTYLLTRIKDEDCRNEVENLIEEENLSVGQTKKLVKLLKQNKDISGKEALVKLRSVQDKTLKKQTTTVSLEEYNSLKEKYEVLLKEKVELENKLRLLEAKPIKVKVVNKVLDKPVKTTLKDGTINEERHSIVVGEYELPVPSGVNIESAQLDYIKMVAVNNAKNNFNINI